MIKFTIPVKPVTKKNSPRVIPNKGKGRPFFILPSEAYMNFEKDCYPYLANVKQEVGVIKYPINLQAHFFVDARRRIDLNNCHEALSDAMVKAGLILDDNRDIIAGTDGSRVYYDKTNPRIEVVITELKEYAQWNNTKDEQVTLFQ